MLFVKIHYIIIIHYDQIIDNSIKHIVGRNSTRDLFKQIDIVKSPKSGGIVPEFCQP